MGKFTKFARIAEVEFSDIVISSQNLGYKLRIYLKDKSFIDLFFTKKTKTLRFSLHWERTHIDKTIYRIDNTPDKKWKKIKSFPFHFHYKSYENVKEIESIVKNLKDLENSFRKFMEFVRNKIISK